MTSPFGARLSRLLGGVGRAGEAGGGDGTDTRRRPAHQGEEGALTMRPLAYGYVSAPAHEPEEQAERWRWEIATFAEREGLTLAGVFTDQRGQSQHAFNAMTDVLHRTDATCVVVIPAAEHLAHLPGLLDADPSAAARLVGAPILAVHPSAGPPPSTRKPRPWHRRSRPTP